MPTLTHLIGLWHCQPSSLIISFNCLPRHCLPWVQCSVFCFLLAPFLPPGSSPSSWQEGWDKERNEGEKNPCQARGKHGGGIAESALGHAKFEGLVETQQAGGQDSYEQRDFLPGKRLRQRDFLPSPGRIFSPTHFFPCPSQVHIT